MGLAGEGLRAVEARTASTDSVDSSSREHSGGVPHACLLTVDLKVRESQSLKAKRAVIRHLVDGARSKFSVAAAETGHQDQWQRSELGFAAVSGSSRHVDDVLDAVERYVWSHPEVEVVSMDRTWIDAEG